MMFHVDPLHDWTEYEAMVFALGGDVVCPECKMGVLIPDAEHYSCDICNSEFIITNDE